MTIKDIITEPKVVSITQIANWSCKNKNTQLKQPQSPRSQQIQTALQTHLSHEFQSIQWICIQTWFQMLYYDNMRSIKHKTSTTQALHTDLSKMEFRLWDIKF